MPPGRWIGIGLIVVAVVTALIDAQVCFPIAGVGIALLFCPMMPKWRCRACGHHWRAPAPKEIEDE